MFIPGVLVVPTSAMLRILATLVAKNNKNQQVQDIFLNNSVKRLSFKNLYDPSLTNGSSVG